jgi:hypothetical protein
MSQITLSGMDKKTKRKIRTRSEKKLSPANSLRKLAGGWTKKEADEFLKSLELFDQVSKTT